MLRPPDFLYRYMSFESAKQLLLTNGLCFKCPMDLNDPFDCQLPLGFWKSESKLKRFLRKTLGDQQDLSKEYKDDIIRVVKKGSISEMQDYVNEGVRGYVKQSRVCCFSRERTNVLMFSHYADGHRGCCIQFKTKNSILADALPVTYVQKFPAFNYIEASLKYGKRKFDEQLRTYVFLTKLKQWEYEREWRIIRYRISVDRENLNEGDLSALILGSSMSEDQRKELIRLAKNRKGLVEIELYQARNDPETSGLRLGKL